MFGTFSLNSLLICTFLHWCPSWHGRSPRASCLAQVQIQQPFFFHLFCWWHCRERPVVIMCNKMKGHQFWLHLKKTCYVNGNKSVYGICQACCKFYLRNRWLKGYIQSKCSPLWSLAMFVEKLLLKHLRFNSEQTKQLFFEGSMKYVWQLLNWRRVFVSLLWNLTSFGQSAISV